MISNSLRWTKWYIHTEWLKKNTAAPLFSKLVPDSTLHLIGFSFSGQIPAVTSLTSEWGHEVQLAWKLQPKQGGAAVFNPAASPWILTQNSMPTSCVYSKNITLLTMTLYLSPCHHTILNNTYKCSTKFTFQVRATYLYCGLVSRTRLSQHSW